MAKKNEIAKAVLLTIAVVGLVTLAVTVPNLASAFGMFMKRDRKYNARQLKQSLEKLEKSNLIGIGQEGDKTIVRLTKKGQERILKYKLEDMKMSRPKKWDGRWRLVIFDIPEKFKANRTVFVLKLKELGFVQLQKSVWVWPHECEKEIGFLKEIYEISPFVRLVRADYLDIQADLKKKFGF